MREKRERREINGKDKKTKNTSGREKRQTTNYHLKVVSNLQINEVGARFIAPLFVLRFIATGFFENHWIICSAEIYKCTISLHYERKERLHVFASVAKQSRSPRFISGKGCLIIHNAQLKTKAAASRRDAMLVEQSNPNHLAPR